MKQMFLDILRELYIQSTALPLSIYKSLSKCQPEEFEECVRLAMKFLFLIQPTEPREPDIDWLWPQGTDITSFITDDDGTTPVPTGSLERLKELCLTGGELELVQGVIN
ncbi:hypothetical protein FRX31_013923 [Thalictrum thalictroides]|uniref:Uncharacterized protein n=1 Tax=Thalictrum thalictroides TaxID=46969 RepID=A0A7J6WIR3_THATH|nr:hypothetical protein FRX31_013923 [Thalictrum thalictroides]